VTLTADVASILRRRRIPFAMIGAAAMAVHGVSRSTADVDLLTMDVSCLDGTMWRELEPSTTVDARSGDADDPLRGIVRFARSGDVDLDLVVGRPAWQQEALSRATLRTEDEVPVVSLPDLILLKLYAGGSQDAWDIEQLLAVDVTGTAAVDVQARVALLPAASRRLWDRLRA
jgi:predicted nucleotidyltransferase